MKVTLKDVARLAGVSVGTASQALNHKPSVSPDARQKVLLAVEKLDYRPHAIAKQLVLQRTNSLACFFVPNVKISWIHPSTWVFYYSVIQGILDVIRLYKYKLQLEIHTIKDITKEEILLDLAREKSVDGIFLVLQIKDDYGIIFRLNSMGFPMVLINTNLSKHISSVCVNNVKAAREGIKYLISLSHKRIGFISGPLSHMNSLERLAGYKEALHEAGLEIREEYIVQGDWTIESGYECIKHIFESPLPTAIFCSNDHMAVGAMRAIREKGLRIPEDISILGYDDQDIAKATSPPLSSIRQPLYEVGKLAAYKILGLIEKKTKPENLLLDAQIVVRNSCTSIK